MEVNLGKIPRGSYFCFGEDPTWKLSWDKSHVEVIFFVLV